MVPTQVEIWTVRITAHNSENILNLCEVEIFGECPTNCGGIGACDLTNGDCTTCITQYYGPSCTTACSTNCGGDGACDKNTGTCTDGCKNRYYDDKCESECSVNCNTPYSCDSASGNCVCKPGYNPPRCDTECQGKYGQDCKNQCSPNCAGTGTCDHVDGTCDGGCVDGFKGSLCDETCPTHCGGSGACNRDTGTCTGVCENGYYGDKCQSKCSKNCEDDPIICDKDNGRCTNGCNNGYYDDKCESACPPNCGGNGACNRDTGTCTDVCKNGYYGDICQYKCSKNCEDDPLICDKGNGRCTGGCKNGYYGDQCKSNCSVNCGGSRACDRNSGTCKEGCNTGFYSDTCQFACSTNCAGNGACNRDSGNCDDGCKPKYFGQKCDRNCSVNCQGNGACGRYSGNCTEGCKPGYEPPICNKECNKFSYGHDCNKLCSPNCAGARTCNHVNGTCHDGCDDGYKDSLCSIECLHPSYGPMCKETCNKNCGGDGTCDHINGTCNHECRDGYLGSKCTEMCPDEKFGKDCNFNCSEFCYTNTTNGSSCDHVDGSCFLGCIVGSRDVSYKGPKCDQALYAGPNNGGGPDAGTVAGAVIGVIVLIALAVVLALLVMRRRRSKGPTTKKQESASATSMRSSSAIGKKRELHDMQNGRNNSDEELLTTNVDEERGNMNNEYCNSAEARQQMVISVKDLPSFLLSHDKDFFQQQFLALPKNENASISVGTKAENVMKNRYKNIVTYDHSRVCLQSEPLKKHGDYINASFIEGYKGEMFIASQGPNKVMMNDFIRMLWEQEVEKVVMLTNLVEESKVKCDQYWPDEGQVQFDEISVKLLTTEVFADYTIRRLQLSKGNNGKAKQVTQFHFTSWPDKGVPLTPWSLVDFEQRVASYPSNKPIVVHCSAGVGRTGTFIAIRNVMREAEDTGQMDFFSTVSKMRWKRVNMIQTSDQYQFLHQAAQVAMLCMGTTVTSEDIDSRIQVLETVSSSGKTKFQEEFQAVCDACSCTDNFDLDNNEGEGTGAYENSRVLLNRAKNRFQNILPKEAYRCYLAKEDGNDSDYINAVLLPSFSKVNQQILTQLPMPKTITDFWRLVIQQKVTLVVAFEVDTAADDMTVVEYLPKGENIPDICPPFEVRSGPIKPGTLWKQQQLFVKDKRKAAKSSALDQAYRLTHLSCPTTDLEAKDLLVLVKHAQSCNAVGEGRTLYMCRNGADYSGLVCVLSLLLDRMDNDHCLTVPLVVGAVKAIRPQVIPTLDQYRLLYQTLLLYKESTNVYSNLPVPRGPKASANHKEEQKDEDLYANM